MLHRNQWQLTSVVATLLLMSACIVNRKPQEVTQQPQPPAPQQASQPASQNADVRAIKSLFLSLSEQLEGSKDLASQDLAKLAKGASERSDEEVLALATNPDLELVAQQVQASSEPQPEVLKSDKTFYAGIALITLGSAALLGGAIYRDLVISSHMGLFALIVISQGALLVEHAETPGSGHQAPNQLWSTGLMATVMGMAAIWDNTNLRLIDSRMTRVQFEQLTIQHGKLTPEQRKVVLDGFRKRHYFSAVDHWLEIDAKEAKAKLATALQSSGADPGQKYTPEVLTRMDETAIRALGQSADVRRIPMDGQLRINEAIREVDTVAALRKKSAEIRDLWRQRPHDSAALVQTKYAWGLGFGILGAAMTTVGIVADATGAFDLAASEPKSPAAILQKINVLMRKLAASSPRPT